MARKFFFTSYEVFFLPQFSTLITLPPSRWTIPRMRSTILSTRSSARSGRTRKMVSYSRSRVPGANVGGPPAVVSVAVCIVFPLGFAAFLKPRGLLRHLLLPLVEPVHRQQGSFQQRRHGRL